MKVTWATFLVATLAITGIVPLSGFFSKDAILHALHSTTLRNFPHVLHFVWFLGLTTALGTAFYMTRLYWLTFEGERAADAKLKHAHESSAFMTIPLVILAFMSVVTLVQGLPIMPNARGKDGSPQTVMEHFLSPVFRTAEDIAAQSMFFVREEHSGLPWSAWMTAWVIALLGGCAAFLVYTQLFKPNGKGELGALALPHKLAANKFYVDEIYDIVIIRPVKLISYAFFKVIDSLLIDTFAVRGTAWVTARTGDVLRLFQTGDAQSYAAVMALAVAGGVLFAVFGGIQ